MQVGADTLFIQILLNEYWEISQAILTLKVTGVIIDLNPYTHIKHRRVSCLPNIHKHINQMFLSLYHEKKT